MNDDYYNASLIFISNYGGRYEIFSGTWKTRRRTTGGVDV